MCIPFYSARATTWGVGIVDLNMCTYSQILRAQLCACILDLNLCFYSHNLRTQIWERMYLTVSAPLVGHPDHPTRFRVIVIPYLFEIFSIFYNILVLDFKNHFDMGTIATCLFVKFGIAHSSGNLIYRAFVTSDLTTVHFCLHTSQLLHKIYLQEWGLIFDQNYFFP